MTFATRPDFGTVRASAGVDRALALQHSDEDMFLLRSPKR